MFELESVDAFLEGKPRLLRVFHKALESVLFCSMLLVKNLSWLYKLTAVKT